MTKKLKPCPCPFCGSKKVGCYASWSLWACQCDECGATMVKRGSKEEAIEAWNQRAERTCRVRQAYFDSDNELHELMEGIAFTPEDTVACVCEACGHDWRYDSGIRPNYCPNCGAKVVSE